VREYEDAARLFPAGTDISLPIFHWPTNVRAMSLGRLRRGRVAVRSFGAVDVSVPGGVPPIRQPSGNACWAATYTMMASWRQNQSMTMEAALNAVGPAWAQKFTRDEGLSGQEKPQFLQQAGLVAEPPVNPSIDGWAQMLQNYGPVWITTDEGTGLGYWAVHARVLTGIHGDGTEPGTMLDITDPGTGTSYQENFATFITKFEHEATTPNVPLRIQIVHWQPGAQSMSLARRSAWLPSSRSRSFSDVAPVANSGARRTPRDGLLQALVESGHSASEAEALITCYDDWKAQARSVAASLLRRRGFAFDVGDAGASDVGTVDAGIRDAAAPDAGPAALATPDQLRRFSPNARDEVINPIQPIMNGALSGADITTPLRIAHFFAQIANETGGFRVMSENLNYDAARLRVVWPSIFTSDEIAQRYAAAGPEAIANKAYGGRLGNGPESSGDGWRYRGRGFMQLTGKDNYRRFGDVVGTDLVANPDDAADPAHSFRLAASFWRAVNCNEAADRDNIEDVTRRVNGGLIGIDDRRQWLKRAKSVWS
jgi:predicted chitinase